MATLKDIAENVGASISSVSLVLNDRHQGRVNASLAASIRKVATDMGYLPNHVARSLLTKRTCTIGLVSDRVATIPFAGHMLAGAQDVLWQEGYLLLLIDTGGHDEMVRPATLTLLQRNVDALIFAATHHRVVELPYVPPETPIVILDGRPADTRTTADFVVPDELAGANAAVSHLINLGHSRVAFCTASTFTIAAQLRLAGYETAHKAAGLPIDRSLVVDATEASTHHALEPARRLLTRVDRPSAVFCFGDQLAMGFYQVATDMGLRIPADLSVVGFDNQQYVADSLMPGLTTVQLPHSDMGKWAARRALARIRDTSSSASSESYLAPCRLVVRSSACPPSH